MKIVPYVGETIVSSDTVSIELNPADRDRADDLVLRTSTIMAVRDERTYALAREAAGQLKSMLNEIADSEKSAKRPFTAIVNAIGTLAKDVGGDVKSEHERILRICAAYVERLEAEEAAKREALRRAQAEAEAKVQEARRATLAATSTNDVARAQLDLARAQLDQETVKSQLQNEPRSLVPGGRLTHPWKFELVDPAATLEAGCQRLLRIGVDILACQDAIKAQLERNPDNPPSLPGIRVFQETRISIRATAQTS